MDAVYDPGACDLCGFESHAVILQLNTGRSLRSDRTIVPHHLTKFGCARCGLVRSGQRLDPHTLLDYYTNEYTLSIHPEHRFYTPQGPVPRSKLLCDWLVSAMGRYRWHTVHRCLEIGAGSGALLQEFARQFPDKTFEGLELNKAAAALANERGLSVYQCALADLDVGQYDLAYAVSVLEHVPSPTSFLREIHKRLSPEGWLFLIQPTQDMPSYDLFFIDHLHHFGIEHLRQYARKCGYREHGLVVGHEWMPNFSLHLWQARDPVETFTWLGPPGCTTCAFTASQILADMRRLDATLARLAADGRRVAVFGLNEVYWLTRAYSALGTFPILCGLDDMPGRPDYALLGFPVLVPEECLSRGVQDVILTMNKLYYPQARERLERLGVAVHPVLS